MAHHIVANSLSDITQIASNPPKYPRNPTEKQRQSLTLYIARVPGSQDIILTTLKPQLKNVTSEDITSSLYYLHVNTEDDARFLAEEEANAMSEKPSESDGEAQKPLPRKPLPETARSFLDLSRSGDPITSSPAVSATADYLRRKPLPDPTNPSLDIHRSEPPHFLDYASERISTPIVDRQVWRKELISRESQTQTHDQAKESIRRRPLGPRQLQSDVSVGREERYSVESQPLNSTLHTTDFVISKTSSDSVRSDLSSFDGIKADGLSKSFSITVIRRDPSSAAQWNVGNILGESQSLGTKATSNSRRPYFDISVHLATPGYTSFRHSPATSFNENLSPLHIQQASTNGLSIAGSGFDRQIRMEGSSIWGRATQQHKRAGSDAPSKRSDVRESSVDSPGVRPDGTADTRDSGSKGYVFLSPWGGRCKFSTGGGGRSLRCKHTLPDSLSSSNAVFESSGSAVVSELRFNLPHSAVFNAPAVLKNKNARGVEPGRFSIPKFDHIRNKLSQTSRPPLPPRPHPTSYAAMYASDDDEPPPLPPRLHAERLTADSSDEQEHHSISMESHHGYTPRLTSDDDERLDLSIGREKAGGGNRGKRAKLGKLIIHDEGFKMLDLVVAANMGVWWTVY